MRQGLDEMLQFDKKPEEKMRVYTYEDAVKRFYTFLFMSFKKKDTELRLIQEHCLYNCCLKKPFISFRLLAANPSVSEQSVHILLERGLVKVKGGMALFCLLWFLLREKQNVVHSLNNLTLLSLLC